LSKFGTSTSGGTSKSGLSPDSCSCALYFMSTV
jgi:hypothetical protein